MTTIISEQQHHRELHGPDKSKVNNNIQLDATPMPWDSLESDTESLVQEKEYQRELHMRIAYDSDLLSAEISKQSCAKSDRKVSEYSEVHIDGLQSLKPKGPQITARHRTQRQTATEDDYADLRYDPNWRQNLEGAQFLNQLKARLSLDSFEGSEDSFKPLDDMTVGQRQEYIVVSNQPALEKDTGLLSQPSSPFHLHPQQDVLDPPKLKDSSMSPERTVQGVREDFSVKHKSVAYQKKSSQRPSDMTPVKAREDIVERNKATFGINAHKQGSYLRSHQQRDKLVETKQPRRTSCETISTCSPESQDNVRDPELMWLQKTQKLKQSHKKRNDPKKEKNNNSDQLRPHITEAKPRPGVHLKPLSERRIISADHLPQRASEDHLLPDAPVGHSYSYDPPQHLPSHSNAPPTVNLNINLHSPANHSQTLNLTQQETLFTLVSQALQLGRSDRFNPPTLQPGYQFHPFVLPNEVQQMGLVSQAVVSSPAPHSEVARRKYTVDRDVTQGLVQRHAGKPLPNAYENASFKNNNRIRIPVLQLPTSPEAEANHYSPKVTPTDEGLYVPQTSGAYPVLPPIAQTNISDTELLSDRSEQQLNPIHRSSSEGYLSQMERHRQLKAKSNYKAYTLKDYKNLKQEVKLGGLGPINTIPEDVAEKIRRQKLYSNVIRHQNKKISRIPSLPAKDPVGSDNKDTIPRIKALEYAKTIAKPKVPSKTNDKPEKKNVSMQAPYLQEMDLFQQATLEMLRRHEEEKRTVAQFKTIRVI